MGADSGLHLRWHLAAPAELHGVPWLAALAADERARAAAAITVGDVARGESVCRIRQAPTHWFGLIDGLLKMSSDDVDGHCLTFIGLPPGGWFGEGTLMKGEPYRYDVVALRRSTVARLPGPVFAQLLDGSLGFNRFLMKQLNERLSQFIAAREIDRQREPQRKIARCLLAMVNPVLYPGVGGVLRITQEELALLVGMSRGRVNEGLQALAHGSAIVQEYGAIRIADTDALRAAARQPAGGY